jgi:adenosine deaminase
MTASTRDLRALPKGHLHIHLELAMRPALLADLAAAYGEQVPAVRGYGSFTAFSEMCQGAMSFLRTREDWERLAADMIDDALNDGVTYLEPGFTANNHAARWGSDDAVWEMVLEVFDKASAGTGVTVRFMSSVDRVFDTPDVAVGVAETALRFRSVDGGPGIVAFGLHNDEVGHPAGDFVEAFRVAREGGLLSAPHAGELEHGGFVRDSIDLLGADRIQHGVRSFEVAGLVDDLAARGTCLDVCPTSNIMLSVFPSLAEHPLPALLAAGVRCSVNADDPLLFGVGILDEYELCRTELGLDDDTIAEIARTSITAGGAPAEVRESALAGIDAWLAG